MIFEHGRFTATDTANTAAALRFYALGLIGYSVVRIVSPTFYALGSSRVAGDGERGSVVVNVRSTSRWCGCSAIAGWRSARRSRRCSTPRRSCGCCGGEIWRASTARAIAATFVRVIAGLGGDGRGGWGADRLLLQWLPGAALPLQALRLALVIGCRSAVLAAAAAAAAHPGTRRGPRPGAAAFQEDWTVEDRGWLGLHRAIWKVASTHVVVDAYTNITRRCCRC